VICPAKLRIYGSRDPRPSENFITHVHINVFTNYSTLLPKWRLIPQIVLRNGVVAGAAGAMVFRGGRRVKETSD
jgi:hypothetical protein